MDQTNKQTKKNGINIGIDGGNAGKEKTEKGK